MFFGQKKQISLLKACLFDDQTKHNILKTINIALFDWQLLKKNGCSVFGLYVLSYTLGSMKYFGALQKCDDKMIRLCK